MADTSTHSHTKGTTQVVVQLLQEFRRPFVVSYLDELDPDLYNSKSVARPRFAQFPSPEQVGYFRDQACAPTKQWNLLVRRLECRVGIVNCNKHERKTYSVHRR